MPGSVAVVTGGGTGIGAACGVALAESGWTVVLAGRRAEPLEAVRAAHPGLALEAAPADVTDEAAVRALFDGVLGRHGRLDLLFNNAGRGAPAAEPDAIGLDEWRAVVDTNVTGTFLCTREAFRIMREQRPQGGRIIMNGSISAHAPRPGSLAYTATKHAITGFTKQVALDGRPYSIACGQIDIGNASSDMTSRMADGVPQADGSVRPEPTMPLADVASAVLTMASLPLTSNVLSMTVMATAMPFVGRG